jgi:hypothetical protein
MAQTVKPYLQAAKPTSIYVNWKTAKGMAPVVRFGLRPMALDRSVKGTTVNLEPKDTSYHTPYHYHEAKITGLKPATGYYYQVTSGPQETSAVHYFRTPPTIGKSTGKLRFIALGDHQVLNYKKKPYAKFDELVSAAKAKAEEVFGKPLARNVNLILNDGDQVDVGKLEHYEKLHFAKSSPLSHELPIITAVGNHETYGKSYAGGGIEAYKDHFVLDDDFSYGGVSSGTERYYTYQMGNVLFLVMDTEDSSDEQLNWVANMVNYATTDPGVSWIISIGHRPYEAEQYSDDYSAWFAEKAAPLLQTTGKFALHIAGHHHLYARGQFKDYPAYHIISGGTAWPQYWGDSKKEDDWPETQGSWSNFAYQLIEIDNDRNELWVRSYTIGSLMTEKDNVLLDEFRYRLGVQRPGQPSVTVQQQEEKVILSGSPYTSAAGQKLNSTEYQISQLADFSNPVISEFRHVENWFGPASGTTDETENIGEGAEIVNYHPPSGKLSSGTYYVRVRYRDDNLGWSNWSETTQFNLD